MLRSFRHPLGALEGLLTDKAGLPVSIKWSRCFCKGMAGGIGAGPGEAQNCSAHGTERPLSFREGSTVMGRYYSLWSIAEEGLTWEILVWAGVDPRQHGCQPAPRRWMARARDPETKQGGRTSGTSTFELEKLVF